MRRETFLAYFGNSSAGSPGTTSASRLTIKVRRWPGFSRLQQLYREPHLLWGSLWRQRLPANKRDERLRGNTHDLPHDFFTGFLLNAHKIFAQDADASISRYLPRKPHPGECNNSFIYIKKWFFIFIFVSLISFLWLSCRSSPPPHPPAPPCVSVSWRCPSAHPAWASSWTAVTAAEFAPGSWTRTAAWPSLATTPKGWSVTLGPLSLLLPPVASAEVSIQPQIRMPVARSEAPFFSSVSGILFRSLGTCVISTQWNAVREKLV